MNEADLFDLSDEELEAAFKEAKAEVASPDIEEDISGEGAVTEESETSEEEIDETVNESGEEVDVDDDGTEQSEDENTEDSDHDASKETEDEEVTEEDKAKSEEETSAEDPKEEENPSSKETKTEEKTEQPVQTYKFKANGKDYEFSSEEIVDQFPKIFGQAMDYTKKMQTIKPWRKTIDAIESAKLSHEDVSLMIDVLKGDKNAITEVLKRTGTDTLELDTEADSKYVAKDYGMDDSALAIKDIVDDISGDQEYATTHSILSKEWDDRSWATITENPEMIRLLHTDVKSGMYATLQPIAEKLKVFGGGAKSDLEYYKEAAQQHFNQVAQQEAYQKQQEEDKAAQEAKLAAEKSEAARLEEVKAKSAKRDATNKASAKRKAATSTKAARAGQDVIDYLDESDEAFDEWYKKLQESY